MLHKNSQGILRFSPGKVSLSNLAIIVLHYRTPEILCECLKRLSHFAIGATIIVVDTDLQTETQVWLSHTYPDVQLISAPNHSMAHAINTGLKVALETDARYFCHMNADVYIDRDIFSLLLPYFSLAGVGMVAPRAYDARGIPQNQGLLYRIYYVWLRWRKAVPVSWLSGCMQLMSRDYLLSVGGLDSSLRFYNEDMDWCYRARRYGWRCLLVDHAVTHLGGSATPKNPAFLLEGLRGGYKISQRYKSRIYQSVHRYGLCLVAYVLWRWGDKTTRKKWEQVWLMAVSHHFETSPFVNTLNDTRENVLG